MEGLRQRHCVAAYHPQIVNGSCAPPFSSMAEDNTSCQRPFVPALSSIVGLVAHVVKRVDPFEQQQDQSSELVEALGTAVRRGFDLPEIVHFASENPQISSRVQIHAAWVDELPF